VRVSVLLTSREIIEAEAEDRALDRLDFALRHLRNTGVELRRERPALAVTLGQAHFGAGALEAAAREFKDALALEPASPDARGGLVLALAGLGRLDEAERELRAADEAGVMLSPSVRAELVKRRADLPPVVTLEKVSQ
jgi:Flp pilus assembly protein TadD